MIDDAAGRHQAELHPLPAPPPPHAAEGRIAAPRGPACPTGYTARASRCRADDRHELTRPVRVRDRYQLLRMATPVHVGGGDIGRPAAAADVLDAEPKDSGV